MRAWPKEAGLRRWDGHAVLMDHASDGPVVIGRTGRPFVIGTDGLAVPVVCAEIVEVPTEDGPVTSRCAARITVLDDEAECWECAAGHGHWARYVR